MLFGCRRLFRVALPGLLLLGGLLTLPPAPAAAETSYHKLKQRLHKVEHGTGVALQQVGETVADGLSDVDLGICLGSDDDDVAPSVPAARSSKPTGGARHPATAHPPASEKKRRD
jgi:hypothetical protein